MISNSLEETKNIAHKFASTLVGGDVVFLEGDLGAGKTSFVQGVLEALGYTEPVRSPTFSIMNMYLIANHPTIERVIHLDFYRFESPREVHSLGLEEMMENKKNVFMIEWPKNGIENGSDIRYTRSIKFRSVNEQTREILIS
ncbi:MAG: tRNA (adenosine(37)-N6)-threonylcarbamoyltransferase complex ATPase subunit type 1 TsaE [Candidatus Uhrbacteria bacterium]|nr:tRNA (adenosine(37)-N6)-threonylcarbamoyltransferase complex ATPase subunit type 1 TsaE [Candidatus Uhrbacteria bacterium]